MAWVAVDKDSTEIIFTDKPCRMYDDVEDCEYWDTTSGMFVVLPKGTIKKLIGKTLTWEDEPVELKEDTVEKITIDIADYRRYLSYANYIQNWAGTVYTCPKCGTLNPEGYICINCHYDKSRKLC